MCPVNSSESAPVLVLGATGYVGGRLVPRLLGKGYQVRAGVRSPAKLACRPYGHHPRLEIVAADLLDYSSLYEAMRGCRAVYYLVHSMQSGGKDFVRADQKAAENAARAAEEAGVGRIIYLGGLGEVQDHLSEHLKSRREVGRILQQGRVPLTHFRAAIILGAGSASFELVRYLVERLPAMVAPRWVHTEAQPIAVGNVLTYLEESLEVEATSGQTFDICGPDVMSYGDLFQLYSEVAYLPRRLILPVPLLSPKLCSYWVHLVTPVPSSIARPLIEGLRNRVVCGDNRIRELIPQRLLTCKEAMASALERIRRSEVETCWADAGNLVPPEWISCDDASYAGGTVLSCDHRVVLRATPEELWQRILTVGGENGWFYANWLWRLRGWMDRLAGGPGLRRGRRDPEQLRVGDSIDFWRVLELEPMSRLRLLAEMRFPGEAYLEFQLRSGGEEGLVEIRQLSKFVPHGLFGILYWYSLAQPHRLIFRGLLRNLARSTGREIVQGPEPLSPSESQACIRPDMR